MKLIDRLLNPFRKVKRIEPGDCIPNILENAYLIQGVEEPENYRLMLLAQILEAAQSNGVEDFTVITEVQGDNVYLEFTCPNT